MRIGIDLGGTKIELIALDGSGNEVLRKRVPTPREDYEATLRTVAALVLEFESSSNKHATVGIGIPGAEGGADSTAAMLGRLRSRGAGFAASGDLGRGLRATA